MYQEIIKKIEPELEKVIDFLARELMKIQGSRVSPSVVEDLAVDYYGARTLLKQMATILISGPRQLSIQPWDKSAILIIEKTILESSLGVNPVVEKDRLLLNFPPPTQESRKNLSRILSEKLESARVTLRHWRDECWRQIQDNFRQGKIREDDKFRAKKELQELVDDYSEKIDKLGEQKIKEIEQ